MELVYARPERVFLKNHADFNEQWLQQVIADDPSILGMGELMLIERERMQNGGGRLDLLLSDSENNRRYEVELMLGATDPSHVIRTIEYWDIERRRYPAYEHVAVLVAEDITSRFLNVLALLSGSIPMIAIQLNALKVGQNIALDFVKVIDLTDLRTDDEEEADRTPTDRAYWEKRSSNSVLAIVNQLCDRATQICSTKHELNYNRHFIGLRTGARSRNFLVFMPRRKHLRLGIKIGERESIKERLEEAGFDVADRKRLWLNITPKQFEANASLVREAVELAAHEYAG